MVRAFELLPLELLERMLLSFLTLNEKFQLRLVCKNCRSFCKLPESQVTKELRKLLNIPNIDSIEFEHILKLEQSVHSFTSDYSTFYIVDGGGHTIRCGSSNQVFPSNIFLTKIGRIKKEKWSQYKNPKDRYIGEQEQKEILLSDMFFKTPIEHGLVTNWDDMEHIWHHAFYNELKICPEEISVILLVPLLNPRSNKERMLQIMFETFNIGAVYVKTQPFMSLLAAGRTTGIVFESGDSLTTITPIFEGHELIYAIKYGNLAGQDVTEELRQRLLLNKREVTTEEANRIKERVCFLRTNSSKDVPKPSNQVVEEVLINGEIILLKDELFYAPEILFYPGSGQKGIHELFHECVSMIKFSKEQFCLNIVLGGGNTLLKGFTERLCNEIVTLLTPKIPIKIISLSYRQHLTWIGTSIWTRLPFMWIPTYKNITMKVQYDEAGPGIVHCNKYPR